MNQAEILRSQGHSRNTLTLDIDGLSRTIIFKSGGSCENPVSVTATASGGIVSQGLYDSWLVEGEVTVDKSLAQWLLNIFVSKNKALNSSAILQTYSPTQQVITKHHFSNARIHKMPYVQVSEMGSDVSMKLSFSLNDLESSDVKTLEPA